MHSRAWARHGSSRAQASARSYGSPAKPGVGKTTLIERFMAEAGDIHCAHGQCVEQYGAGEPYLPVLEALTALCRRDTALAELIRAVAPTWLLQLPWLSSAAEREALRRELTGRARRACCGSWASCWIATRRIVRCCSSPRTCTGAIKRRCSSSTTSRAVAPALDCCGSRASALQKSSVADHPLATVRRELRLHRLCDEIVLDPFSEREVGEYLAATRSRARGGRDIRARAARSHRRVAAFRG